METGQQLWLELPESDDKCTYEVGGGSELLVVMNFLKTSPCFIHYLFLPLHTMNGEWQGCPTLY